MKNCPKCGRSFDDSWVVCVSCDVPLDRDLEVRLAGLEEQAKRILLEIEAMRGGKNVPAKAVAAPTVSTPPASSVLREDAESRIGKYVLSKIGVISIVTGIGFFLSYAFKYLSPFVKIGIGFAAGAAVIALGVKIEKSKKYKWYGRGLICGGWVAVYFTTFAMYHIQTARILPNPLIDFVCLSVVIVAMTRHLLKYRSEGMIVLVMLLGYVTAGMSGYASFAMCYIALLAGAAGFLLVRTGWRTLGAFALLGTYIAHMAWVRPNMSIRPAEHEFWISIGFLTVYWTIYNLTARFCRAETSRQQNDIAAFILANSVCFGFFAMSQVRVIHPEFKSHVAWAAAGILLLFRILSSGQKGKGYLKTSFLIASVAFLSGSLRYWQGQGPAYLVWSLEVPALMFTGLYLGNHLYRMAAAALSLAVAWGMLTSFGLPHEKIVLGGAEARWSFVLYVVGTLSFYLCRYGYLIRKPSTSEHRLERVASHAYTVLASICLIGVMYYEIHPKLVTLAWSSGALLLFGVGFFLKDKIFRYCAIAIIAACLFRVVFVDLADVNTVQRIFVFLCLGLVLLAVSYGYAKASALLRDHPSTRSGASKIGAGLCILLISLPIVVTASLGPSQFRKESTDRQREEVITANFIAGKNPDTNQADFLRLRQFSVLERTLLSLPMDKDGRNLGLYARAFDLGLRSKALYIRVGEYYEGTKEAAKAVDAYEKAVALDPSLNDWQTRYAAGSLARLYKASADYPRAVEYYEKYLKHTKNVETLYDLAVCYEKMGMLDKALAKLNEAVGLDRGSSYAGEIESLRSDIYGKKEMLEKTE